MFKDCAALSPEEETTILTDAFPAFLILLRFPFMPNSDTMVYPLLIMYFLKSSVLNSKSDNNILDSYLMNYGVRLSNFERMSNLGDLDSEYIILLEVPQSDVNFVINNMDNLILAIPTDFAPNWVVDELNETYYENLYQDQSLDFL